jgi:hypothetical protein
VITTRLAAGLRCYVPERTTETWARGCGTWARRVQLSTDATAGVQQLRDLLECVWPAALAASSSPFRSVSWCASMAAVLDRAPNPSSGSLSHERVGAPPSSSTSTED